MARKGRPKAWTDAKRKAAMNEICERLADGEPMAQICRDAHLPHLVTVYDWMKEDEDFDKRSTRAMEAGTHRMAADCLTIADEKGADPSDKRIRIDTRLRLIGKWNRRVYGDKVDHEHKGDVNISVNTGVTRPPGLLSQGGMSEDDEGA